MKCFFSIKRMNCLTILVACLAIVIIFSILAIAGLYHSNSVARFTNMPEGPHVYKVINRYPNKKRASEILHELNESALKLIHHLDMRYKNTPNPQIREIIDRLQNRYPKTLHEVDPVWEAGHKAYTRNSKYIFMCLRKKSNEFYDINLLKFVFFHELSHIATDKKYIVNGDDHPEQYWKIFRFILINAESLGLIRIDKYSKTNPVYYGTIKIDSNPYYDTSLML